MFIPFDTPLPPPVPPPGVAADWTIPQRWERFGAEDHRVWDVLFERQRRRLAGRVVRDFAEGLDLLELGRPGIPDFDDLNARLHRRTGWTVVAVPGLIPDPVFFRHLAERRFPAGNFIRPAGSLDYLEEPDVFHDVFGHVPMLASPQMAEAMQALGELGIGALAAGTLDRLSRLYWYTVEFGLAREDGENRILGAGLASSFGEAGFALDDPRPRRRPFDLATVLRTRYRSDRFQAGYFVLDDIGRLPAELARTDVLALAAALAGAPDLDPATGEEFRRL